MISVFFSEFSPNLSINQFHRCRESPLLENPKSLRSLIKNIGGSSSPILNRKLTGNAKKSDCESSGTKRTTTKGRMNSISKSEVGTKRSMSCDSRLTSTRKRDSSVDATSERKTKDKIESSYILLSQVCRFFLLSILRLVFTLGLLIVFRRNTLNTKRQ